VTDEQDMDMLVQKGAVVEIDANEIASIILRVCHTSAFLAERSANEIIDYMSAKVLASGRAEDITKPEGPPQ
jgi:hypothetical protein